MPIHFPEIVSLVDSDPTDLFPGMEVEDVVNEVLFTFVSLLLLFGLNIFAFGYTRSGTPVSWKKITLSFAVTWLLSSLLGKGFFFIHHLFDVPAVDAIIHYNLHPFRDFLLTCIVTGSCYVIYLHKRNRRVQLENQQLQAENLLNQYEALKNQLNPHMLFNSLNTLRSLIWETPDKGQDYLQELSKVLRYTLQEEMEFVQAFILPYNLDELAESLNPVSFFRVNRQYIISRKSVYDIDLWFNSRLSVNLKVPTSEKIVVSKARVTEFKEWFTGE